MDSKTEHYKVGEAAKLVGLSVRALHHYEACGLLRPRRNKFSDHRLYDQEDLRRLKQIRLLRSYGLDLITIQSCLRGTTLTPVHQLRAKLSALRDHIAETQRQANGLECLLITLDAETSDHSQESQEEANKSEQHHDDVLKHKFKPKAFELTVDLMSAANESLKEHHLDSIAQITRELGSEGIAQQKQRWRTIVEEMRTAMIEGRSPNDPQIIDLARQRHCLIDDAYQGNMELRAEFCAMISTDLNLCKRWMDSIFIDRKLLQYLGQATNHIQFNDRGRPQS